MFFKDIYIVKRVHYNIKISYGGCKWDFSTNLKKDFKKHVKV